MGCRQTHGRHLRWQYIDIQSLWMSALSMGGYASSSSMHCVRMLHLQCWVQVMNPGLLRALSLCTETCSVA